ncbi:hypothetical protein BJ973_003866 [Actinoplanes tereljensis]|uniref:Uncharacterized protein n=1 Tax=Paractinoplanes tereljensis TaxID=571912 RepID=A0A919NWE9_9ACTN|nr:hypothetical protein [Actinoplanes tereljensis]GIF25588.1 hypothetical protein Ate02nite_83180 [Actinoplanes tereljensis]
MAVLSLQFHADRGEIAQLAGRWVNQLGLWLAAEELGPVYRSSLLAAGHIDGELRLPGSVHRLLLSFEEIDLDGSGPFGLVGRNPDALTILLGGQSTSELGLSILQANTDDQRSLLAWRRIRRSMTTSFRHGARVVNSWTGARGTVRDHYFSPAAKTLYDSGVRMIGLNDVLSYEFD